MNEQELTPALLQQITIGEVAERFGLTERKVNVL